MFSDQIVLADRRHEPISLKCAADGVPTPRIRWLLDGVELYTNSHVRIESFAQAAAAGTPSNSEQHHSAARTTTTIVSHLNISSLLIQVSDKILKFHAVRGPSAPFAILMASFN